MQYFHSASALRRVLNSKILFEQLFFLLPNRLLKKLKDYFVVCVLLFWNEIIFLYSGQSFCYGQSVGWNHSVPTGKATSGDWHETDRKDVTGGTEGHWSDRLASGGPEPQIFILSSTRSPFESPWISAILKKTPAKRESTWWWDSFFHSAAERITRAFPRQFLRHHYTSVSQRE